MMFSSGKHAAQTTDDAPFQALAGGDRGARCGVAVLPGFKRLGIEYRFNPRPEFDRPLANPANRILSDIRTGYHDVASALDLLHDDAREWWNPAVVTDEQIDHARAVLTRLAALAEIEHLIEHGRSLAEGVAL